MKGEIGGGAGLFERAGSPPRVFSAQYLLARLIAQVVQDSHVRCQETCELLGQETLRLGVQNQEASGKCRDKMS